MYFYNQTLNEGVHELRQDCIAANIRGKRELLAFRHLSDLKEKALVKRSDVDWARGLNSWVSPTCRLKSSPPNCLRQAVQKLSATTSL